MSQLRETILSLYGSVILLKSLYYLSLDTKILRQTWDPDTFFSVTNDNVFFLTVMFPSEVVLWNAAESCFSLTCVNFVDFITKEHFKYSEWLCGSWWSWEMLALEPLATLDFMDRSYCCWWVFLMSNTLQETLSKLGQIMFVQWH